MTKDVTDNRTDELHMLITVPKPAGKRDKRNRRAQAQDWKDIESVVTLAEACQRWSKARSHIMTEINLGRIAGRQSGKVWLVSYESLYRRWGPPHYP